MTHACRQWGVHPTRYCLVASVPRQKMCLLERRPGGKLPFGYEWRKNFVVSTSRFGVGQRKDSNLTPLGLHRVAQKVGGGWPIGTVFQSRVPVGSVWQGMPQAAIAHRILWLEGLEPGLNRGGEVDTFERYVYVHGVGDELTVGRPASRGCIHMTAADLLPLFDLLPAGTLVWITNVW
jgi:hypothetical protein